MPEYETFVERELRYYHDDWSNTGPSSRLRHQIIFHTANYEKAMVFDLWTQDMMTWCDDNIGLIDESWHCTRSQSIFYFKDIESAMAFKLRWS